MRALTLHQPWAGLVAAGIKLVENRSRPMINARDFGKPFAIHASRLIDRDAISRIGDIDDAYCGVMCLRGHGHAGPCDNTRGWWHLAEITSAVIGVATVDRVLDPRACGIYPDHPDAAAALPPDQRRWFFGPLGYVLRDVIALPEPVPCRGWQGFWTLPDELERQVTAQLGQIARAA